MSSVWGHSVHFAKFLMVRFFQKATAPTVFIQFQPKFMESMAIGENTGYYFFCLSAEC